tara:strand:+ start:180 stop:512 length:333 start_codon:yes stop_codon:yes gene_type:complete
MAVTKDLTKAIPYEDTSNKVAKWVLEYTYENDSKDDATYYKSVFSETIEQEDAAGNVNFALQTKEEFSKADLVALCPVSHWDEVFASQVDSVITNPVVSPTADESFNIPS